MASAVSALVLAALASVLTIGVRALPEPDDAADRSSQRIGGLAMLHDDVGSAVSIVSASAADFSFRVSDRDGDGDEEVVRYWWSGVEGEGLNRTVNDAHETVVMPALSRAEFSYDWLPRTVASGSTATGSVEEIASWSGATPQSHRINSTSRAALCLLPRLPADATAWQVTKIRIRATAVSGLNVTRASLRLGGSDTLATQTALATSSSAILVLGSSAGWMDFNFSAAPEVAAGQWVSFHFLCTSLLGAVDVQYADKDVPDGRAVLALGSSDTNWIIMREGSLAFELYGRLRTPSGTAVESRLTSFAAAFTPRESGSGPVLVGIRTPGRPKEE